MYKQIQASNPSVFQNINTMIKFNYLFFQIFTNVSLSMLCPYMCFIAIYKQPWPMRLAYFKSFTSRAITKKNYLI